MLVTLLLLNLDYKEQCLELSNMEPIVEPVEEKIEYSDGSEKTIEYNPIQEEIVSEPIEEVSDKPEKIEEVQEPLSE